MRRRIVHWLGTLLIIGGFGLLAYAATTWLWQDPATGLYTAWEQRKLTDAYEHRVQEYTRTTQQPAVVDSADWGAQIRREAAHYATASARGDAIGRIEIPRLGVDMVLVNGTDGKTLRKGPGRYAGTRRDIDAGDIAPPRSYMPGEGELVYVAGHRTTYQAPFSHIDRLRVGDPVVVELPYARFVYRVTGHRIVKSDRLDVLRSKGHEQLVLQACHPRFFASERYLVFAAPVRVRPRGSERPLDAEMLAAAG